MVTKKWFHPSIPTLNQTLMLSFAEPCVGLIFWMHRFSPLHFLTPAFFIILLVENCTHKYVEAWPETKTQNNITPANKGKLWKSSHSMKNGTKWKYWWNSRNKLGNKKFSYKIVENSIKRPQTSKITWWTSTIAMKIQKSSTQTKC